MTDPAELADLRRRAYGPGAVVDDDDLDRLQRLEDEQREGTDAAAEPAPEPGPEPVSTTDAEASVPPPRASLGEVLRRRGVIGALAGIAVVAAVAGAAWLVAHDDATILHRVAYSDLGTQQPLAATLDGLDVDRDSYVQYESWERFTVWTADRPAYGSQCLLLIETASISPSFNGLYGYSCTPEGIDPTVDIPQFAPGDDQPLGDRPAGSVARFVLRGDHVEVRVVDGTPEPLIPSPAPR